ILERTLRHGALPERAVGIEPEVAVLAKADVGGVPPEEVERGAAGVDVDGLPPGRARAARVEFGGGVEAREVEIDDDEPRHASRAQTPCDRRADDASAHDEDADALHAPEGTPWRRNPHDGLRRSAAMH